MTRQTLLDLLAGNEFEQLFGQLKKLSPRLGKSLRGQILLMESRYNGLQKDLHRGTVGRADSELTLNQIRSSLSYTIEQIPNDVFSTENTTATGGEYRPREDAPTPPKPPSPIPWILGTVLLLGGVAFLLFERCPSGPQFFGIRLLMALGAAGVGTLLPGAFQWKGTALKAAGPLGLAVLVYLVNPAKLVASDDCATSAFTLTVRLEKPDLPGYPAPEIGQFKIWQNNDWKPASAIQNENLVIDFKNLQPDMVGKKVPVKMEARFWKLAADSLLVSNESSVLRIAPDGSLRIVTGRVVEADGGQPISGVSVTVAGRSMETDEYGKYYFEISEERQRKEYPLRAEKAGYERVEKIVFPGDKILEISLKK